MLGEANSWDLQSAGSGCEALELIQSGSEPHLVLIDLARGDSDGLFALRWLRRMRPELPVVLLGFADDAQHRVEAVRLGAHDYLLKPIEDQQLEAVVRRHLHVSNDQDIELEIASEQVVQVRDDRFFMAAGPLTRKLRTQAELLAQVDVPLLIVGESGSGKETTARLIHKLSVRSSFPFLKVSCAALPADLLERELFGSDGTFWGAARNQSGKFELAQKGTIFLDDIADMPASLQAKLLLVLQERQFSRTGSASLVPVDVRIMAATSSHVEQNVAERRLREDLYYRLSAFTVHVPALRQRKEEIPVLLAHYMNQLARRYGLPSRNPSPAILDACLAHSWPGNLRELEGFVKRYLVMNDEELALSELGKNGNTVAGEPANIATVHNFEVVANEGPAGLRSLIESVKGEAERNAIAHALEQTHWNRKAAARLLKVSYRTLLYKIQQYHMSPPPNYISSSFNGQGMKGNGHGP